MNMKKVNKYQTILLVFTVILFFVGLALSIKATKARNHDIDDISVKIVGSETAQDGYRSYVNMDFEIENGSDNTLAYIELIVRFTDKSGKQIGTMTSSFGSSTGMGLESGEKVILTSYLSESGSNFGTLFAGLYQNGVEAYDLDYEVTYAEWEDGYSQEKDK